MKIIGPAGPIFLEKMVPLRNLWSAVDPMASPGLQRRTAADSEADSMHLLAFCGQQVTNTMMLSRTSGKGARFCQYSRHGRGEE